MIKNLLIFTVALITFTLGSLLWIKDRVKPVSTDSQKIDFLISKGSSVSQIGNNLEKSGLIKNAIVFKFFVQATSSQNKIQAGEFQLSPNMTMFNILDTLKKGPAELWVTIPEGLRHDEIADRFTKGLSKDEVFKAEFIKLAQPLEGYLFPDTYLFPKDVAATKIVDKMKSTFTKKVDADITLDQLIMASIIERETKGNLEKPVVAGILFKRLANDWPLQVDASIQYAKGDWKPILISDKNLNSRYNTYKFQGLPPGPISNPGLASLQAAMNPEESEYWYYIHDDSGKIHYAKNIDEHNKNINTYLR